MSYEHEGHAMPPPLREVQVAGGDREATWLGIGADLGDSRTAAVKVMPSATRNGGSDLHPSGNALREIRIGRSPDVREETAASTVLREAVSAGRGARFVPMLAWGILGLFFLWLYCQIVPLVTFTISCHGWRMWAALALLAIPSALVGLVAVCAFRLFRRLPSVPQVVDAPGRSFELKDQLLSRYIRLLPESRSYAAASGFEGSQREEVVGILDLLSGAKPRHYSDEIGWLDDFRRFQGLQRERADRIIGRYCKLIGLKTAASPWKIVDVFCVFVNSTLMVAELGRLYNRRVDGSAAFRLVFRWFLNIYISGELGQIGESAAGIVGEGLKGPVRESLSGLDWVDGDWAGTVAQSMPFLAKVAGKAVEGGINAYFAWRMGRKAVAAFEPLAPVGA